MGWLSSYAEGNEKTWGERIVENGNPLPVVEIEEGQFYLNQMKEMGPIRNNGYGLRQTSDGEINDYFKGIQIDLLNWEFLLMRKMCNAFLQGIRTGNDRFGIMPMNRSKDV